METSKQVLTAYGEGVLRINSRHRGHAIVSSLFQRRPKLSWLSIKEEADFDEVIKGLLDGIDKGYCDHLQVLDMRHSKLQPEASLSSLFQALGGSLGDDGRNVVVCPRLSSLATPFNGQVDMTTVSLGVMLQSRMMQRGEDGRRCCGLRRLELHPTRSYRPTRLTNLSIVLSSGACEALEELHLHECCLDRKAQEALTERMIRTRAPKLRTLSIPSRGLLPCAMQALSSMDVAVNLQILRTEGLKAQSMADLIHGLRGRQEEERSYTTRSTSSWLHLHQLSIITQDGHLISDMMHSFMSSGLELKALGLLGVQEGRRLL